MSNEGIKTNSIQAWIKAIRPKTLSGAAVPILIGTAMALKNGNGSNFQIVAAILCFIFAFIMQIDANFINDYFDFKHGNDNETRLGPPRACAEGWVTLTAMKSAILFTTFLACLAGLPLVYYGGWQVIIIGVCCVIFCFLYTTTLSYLGLGDLLVLIFFGIIPICMTYYVVQPEEKQTITSQVFLLSLACGFVVDTLLIINNFRDRDNDLASKKFTLITRVGAKVGIKLYLFAGIMGIFLLAIAFTLSLSTPLRGLCAIIIAGIPYLFLHYRTYKKMRQIWQGKELNIILGETARNILIFGILCSSGLFIL